ncbi:hypothetical protein BJV78DRAFT_1227265, partial [Lactifluus subvellereus]
LSPFLCGRRKDRGQLWCGRSRGRGGECKGRPRPSRAGDQRCNQKGFKRVK